VDCSTLNSSPEGARSPLAHLHSAHDYIRLYDGSPDVLRASLARIQSAATILTRLGIDSRLTAEERAA